MVEKLGELINRYTKRPLQDSAILFSTPGMGAICVLLRKSQTLRAKGTLISEPRFSTPCDMRFFPREKGKMAFVEGFFFEKPFSPFSRGKNRISQRVENRGSLIGVPVALRGVFLQISATPKVEGKNLQSLKSWAWLHLGFCRTFLQQAFYYVNVLQNLPAEPQRFWRNLGPIFV